jgi:hypothetical protein
MAACQDDRVVGCLLLDWYAYRTWGYYLRYYGPRLFRLGPWLRMRERAFQRFRKNKQVKAERQVDPYARQIPPVEGVSRYFQILLDRGVRFLCVYTGGQDARFNHAGQFFKMFPRITPRDAVRAEYIPDAQHTFPMRVHRRELLGFVLEWSEAFRNPASGEEEGETPRTVAGRAP